MLRTGEYGCEHDFAVTGVSYIGNPRPGTAMFCQKKVEHLLENLRGVAGCLVFIGRDMDPGAALREKHCLVPCDDPALEYGRLARRLWDEKSAAEAKRAYTRHPGGYTLGENVTLGEGVVIEPDVLLGHDVVVGDGCVLLAGAKVRNARLGKNCLIKENAVIGCQGFTQYREADGSWQRLYNFGGVVLEDEVEVGANSSVCRAAADTTRLGRGVKLDDQVYVAHDVQIGENTRLTGSVTVGGYCAIGEGVFMGFGATLRNRITVGDGATVGMGSVVVKPVPAGATVYGCPAAERGAAGQEA